MASEGPLVEKVTDRPSVAQPWRGLLPRHHRLGRASDQRDEGVPVQQVDLVDKSETASEGRRFERIPRETWSGTNNHPNSPSSESHRSQELPDKGNRLRAATTPALD